MTNISQSRNKVEFADSAGTPLYGKRARPPLFQRLFTILKKVDRAISQAI